MSIAPFAISRDDATGTAGTATAVPNLCQNFVGLEEIFPLRRSHEETRRVSKLYCLSQFVAEKQSMVLESYPTFIGFCVSDSL